MMEQMQQYFVTDMTTGRIYLNRRAREELGQLMAKEGIDINRIQDESQLHAAMLFLTASHVNVLAGKVDSQDLDFLDQLQVSDD